MKHAKMALHRLKNNCSNVYSEIKKKFQKNMGNTQNNVMVRHIFPLSINIQNYDWTFTMH